MPPSLTFSFLFISFCHRPSWVRYSSPSHENKEETCVYRSGACVYYFFLPLSSSRSIPFHDFLLLFSPVCFSGIFSFLFLLFFATEKSTRRSKELENDSRKGKKKKKIHRPPWHTRTHTRLSIDSDRSTDGPLGIAYIRRRSFIYIYGSVSSVSSDKWEGQKKGFQKKRKSPAKINKSKGVRSGLKSTPTSACVCTALRGWRGVGTGWGRAGRERKEESNAKIEIKIKS